MEAVEIAAMPAAVLPRITVDPPSANGVLEDHFNSLCQNTPLATVRAFQGLSAG